MNTSYQLSSLSTSFYVTRPTAYRVATSYNTSATTTFVILRPLAKYLGETKTMGGNVSIHQQETEFPTVYGYIQ